MRNETSRQICFYHLVSRSVYGSEIGIQLRICCSGWDLQESF